MYDAGSLLAGYELLERLGRGGMGEVWLARHAARGDRVAIKVLFPRPDRREEASARFEREARAAARIGHPAIVRVLEHGADAETGALYIVMEHLEGESLRAWMARPGASALEGLSLLRELLEPLAAAHALCADGRPAPVVHRDLKPENVFVLAREGEGRVKLLDFGIAREAGSREVTDTGVGMGTAAYMSPEQATDARDVDPSADVWSVGVMLYELLAGRPPFEAPSRNEIISKILTRDPAPLASVAPHVPKRLARLVAACLEKEPSRRPPDARALADELDAILSDPSARARIAALSLARSELAVDTAATRSERAAPRRARRAIALTGALGLAAAMAAAIAVWPRSAPRPTARPASPPPRALDAGAGDALNRWVEVAPSAVLLGVGEPSDDEQSGFRASAGVRAPSAPYAMQEHEVTFGELEPWLPPEARPSVLGADRPSWLPADPVRRARFPATGLPWSVARDYCASIGGALPTEAQWEHAARGAERRRYSWGDEPPDPERTNLGPGAHPVEVMTRDQDRTPGEPAIWDLSGNAREWTLDVWRGSAGGAEPWAVEGGVTHRAVRGLPLMTASPWRPPDEAPIAHRIPLCATGPCPPGTDDVRRDVGFRCVR